MFYKFLLHMYCAFLMFRLGYFYTKNTEDHDSWGFIRLNFERESKKEYAIVDLDYDESRNWNNWSSYSVLHTMTELFRWSSSKKEKNG